MSATQMCQVNWKEFNKRSSEFLKELQKTLLPEHADEIIAIDVENGGHVLGKTRVEVFRKFREQFPGKLYFMVRVDGGPVIKFHRHIGW
jgi:hypothetical protein